MHYIIKSERMQEDIIHTFFTQKDTSTAPPDVIFHIAGVVVKVSLLYNIKYQRELHLPFSKMLLQNPEKLNRRKHKKNSFVRFKKTMSPFQNFMGNQESLALLHGRLVFLLQHSRFF